MISYQQYRLSTADYENRENKKKIEFEWNNEEKKEKKKPTKVYSNFEMYFDYYLLANLDE